MKIVKGILITLIILVAIVATVGFLSPSYVHVERSLVINAPPQIVFEQINNLKNWKKWSPWYKKDTAMKMEYNGIEAGAGASYKWSSKNKNVGNGEMTITSSSRDTISTAMNFMENGIATAKFSLTKAGNGTKVTWTMESDMGMNPIGRIFGLFMDKMVGPDFENGLTNLNQVAKAIPVGPKKYRGYEVMEEDVPEKVYILKKDSMSWDKIAEFYQKTLPAIYEAIGKANLEMTGAPSGLYFKWDSTNKTTLMGAGIQIKGSANTKVKGFETVVLTAGKNLHVAYYGGYNKIANAHFAMSDYINEKGFIQGSPVIEEYVSDPGKEADSTKWLTNVYYLVK
ncbi:MAG: SRPBCC family protein [Bacteroidia bacterium]